MESSKNGNQHRRKLPGCKHKEILTVKAAPPNINLFLLEVKVKKTPKVTKRVEEEETKDHMLGLTFQKNFFTELLERGSNLIKRPKKMEQLKKKAANILFLKNP